MAGKINKAVNLARNMGARYVLFRTRYELLRRSGLLKRRFPGNPVYKQYVTLTQWKQQNVQFFFSGKEAIKIPRNPQPELKEVFNNLINGKLVLFNGVLADLGVHYDWVTNPDNGFRYDVKKHWTEIADYSPKAGDIKFVWEKSRFSYLYDIIRYDYHFNEDCAELVFRDILSWIKGNPVNYGPNYRCSQEMSLRVLNWTFALYYYRNSPHLTDEVFNRVQHTIYWHIRHVYEHIDFSRIAVRNNHAVTETLALYIAGLLFPAFPGAALWKKQGKKWFEKEIAYQVYDDGTYLQFSMNYHRMVVQLLTWGIVLSEKNGERFSDVVYSRAEKSLHFLRTCMIDENGWLPNYGANDGALFFKLSTCHYRDYRPQLHALAAATGLDAGMNGTFEDALWYGISAGATTKWLPADGMHKFETGGYYIVREPDTLTFIRCGRHNDRPSQADNMHLDVWYKGENILVDAGSYKYNTDAAIMRYFSGTESHNTVMLDDNDQMLKGGRFIWYHWTQCIVARLLQENGNYVFRGAIRVFGQFGRHIVHRRTVIKHKGRPVWEIKDEIFGAPAEMQMRQLWHYFGHNKKRLTITAKNAAGEALQPQIQDGWYSSLYGQKEKTEQCIFCDVDKKIEATITIVQ